MLRVVPLHLGVDHSAVLSVAVDVMRLGQDVVVGQRGVQHLVQVHLHEPQGAVDARRLEEVAGVVRVRVRVQVAAVEARRGLAQKVLVRKVPTRQN